MDTYIIEPKQTHRYSLFLLHGLGADGSQFETLVTELALPDRLGIRYVFPQAPNIPVTINKGYVMPAWYDILYWDKLSGVEDTERIVGMQKELEQLLMQEPIAMDHIFLGGFSQGGAMALHTGLTGHCPVAGIIALSTYLPLMAERTEQDYQAKNTLPIFMAHGTLDDIVPHALGLLSKERINTLGYKINWHNYPIGHHLCQEEVLDLRKWLLTHIEDAK